MTYPMAETSTDTTLEAGESAESESLGKHRGPKSAHEEAAAPRGRHRRPSEEAGTA
ncbi:hypothetical protein [Streptomyces sp. NPDC058045]|uniref:hypothetical protein n=1 Tax=Streptomyces sp. NPDC058045 TaxID=3346311 RepID=UPI0036E8DA55